MGIKLPHIGRGRKATAVASDAPVAITAVEAEAEVPQIDAPVVHQIRIVAVETATDVLRRCPVQRADGYVPLTVQEFRPDPTKVHWSQSPRQ